MVSTGDFHIEQKDDPFKAMVAAESQRNDPISSVSQMPRLNKFGRKAAKQNLDFLESDDE